MFLFIVFFDEMKNLKPVKLKDYSWKKIDVFLKVESYERNGQIAIMLYEKKTLEYYSDLSVFITPFEYQNFMAVDTNNLPHAEELIQEYNLWERIDDIQSWFCTYPIYAMRLDELRKYDSEWVEKLEKTEFSRDGKPAGYEWTTIWDIMSGNF